MHSHTFAFSSIEKAPRREAVFRKATMTFNDTFSLVIAILVNSPLAIIVATDCSTGGGGGKLGPELAADVRVWIMLELGDSISILLKKFIFYFF
jgi:hypothetical protein